MKQEITLNEVAGYVTEKAVWKMMADLSSAESDGLCYCVPEEIVVNDDSFSIRASSKSNIAATPFAPPQYDIDNDEFAAVWSLGAIAFYALMGVAVLEGKGGEQLTEKVKVPRIGLSHCSPLLSEIIYSCLSYSPSQRPTRAQIRETATRQLSSTPQPSKRLSLPSGKKYSTSLVKFWPEEMGGPIVLILMLLLPLLSFAQNTPEIPSEMNTLVRRCKDLRNTKKHSLLIREFTYDSLWTLMDELSIDRQGECTTKDKVKTLKLNDLCYRIIKLQSGVTNAGGRFRNGMDKRYNYSLIELTVKKKAQVAYDISSRRGKQIFAFIPLNDKAEIKVLATRNGKSCGRTTLLDHVIYLFIDDDVNATDVIHLSIHNLTNDHQSFVVINYNSRNP